ncbi:putative TTHA0068-like domain-containing protein [Rosa chinensis]|uniref:Putative TTHA0068-like domain-containing protein n=1 Tax=Rosa chinensis TaxID=74649 RepID=A0A2P6RHB2_ROSCH|nr:uncharacterized protein LOC112193382 isoform X1 [Rosa chinensis]PRQ45815.1 putative TTHA0068-like domain-containing protein [Rosa chinensis]
MAFPASAICSLTSPVFSRSSTSNSLLPSQTNPITFCSSEYYSKPFNSYTSQHSCRHYSSCFRISYRFSDAGEGEDEAEDCTFDEAVVLFNTREYYKCHDFLESLWNKAEEPTRTLFHGILQCAVGFHHLFNQNHKGAMMELGEGLCKLRKMNFKTGPFYEFEQQISAALDFIYQTQIELAACGDDVCVAMDRSERSYQLLGRYAAGQLLYTLQLQADDDPNETMYIVFHPRMSYGGEPQKVKLPTLNATTQHLTSHGL